MTQFLFPAAFAQQRLWLLDRLQPGNPYYNVPLVIRLTGQLEAAVLERSLQEIVNRHESLRTTFALQDNALMQVVRENLTLHLPEIETEESNVQTKSYSEAIKPFDLENGPLIRTTLLKTRPDTHYLLLTMHHIISDGWSIKIIFEELRVLYEAFLKNEESPLPPLEIQYVDYTAWQQDELSGEHLEQLAKFWQDYLAGAPTLLELPTDYPYPEEQSFEGDYYRLSLPVATAEAVSAFARREKITPFAVYLAAFNVLISRYTNQTDFVTGTPVANRSRVEIENLIGFFVNTVVLRAQLDNNPAFTELVQQTHQNALAAFEHQDIPFEKLVEIVQPQRDNRRNPLFQVMFALQNIDASLPNFGGLQAEMQPIYLPASKFDLSFMVELEKGKLTLALEYNTALYERESMERLAQHYANLLDAALQNPALPVRQLPFLTAAERQQLLVDWNANSQSFPEVASLTLLVEQQAARQPDSLALSDKTGSLTYAQLNEQANQLAHFLRQQGVGSESGVAACLPRTNQTVVALLAILKAGGFYIPLDPAYPAERSAYILDNAQVRWFITQDDPEVLSSQLAAKTAELNLEVFYLDQLLDSRSGKLAGYPTSNPPLLPTTNPRNLMHVLYTSGSTGKPKGVALEQQGVLALIGWTAQLWSAEERAGVLLATSLCFDLSVYELWCTLALGGRVIVAENALELLDHPLANEVTLLNTVPSAIAELLRLDGVPSSVRVVNLAGEPLSNKLAQQIYSNCPQVARVYNLYGPTEDTTYSTWYLVERGSSQPVRIGQVLPNSQAYVLDSQLAPVPLGVAGELYLGGVSLARGYYRRDDLTAERFVTNPYAADYGSARLYKTGDLVRWRWPYGSRGSSKTAQGELEYLGRLDQQVKLRGFRIELDEIGRVLENLPGVSDSAIMVREDTPGDKRIVAYAVVGVTVSNSKPDTSELKRGLEALLPPYMVPGAIVILDELPRLPNGKLNRHALPAPAFEPISEPAQTSAPTQATESPAAESLEEKIAAVWREVLELKQVGFDANFFDLGGHSLLLTQVFSRLREALDVKVELINLFKYPTIRGLAQFLSGKQAQPKTATSITNITSATNKNSKPLQKASGEIAVIGLAGRFPGANNIREFWENLRNGVESIHFFSDEELRAAGVSEQQLKDPNYVKASGILDKPDYFDAAFFGYSPREAEIMDPQQRFFLECSWEALEDAGYAPENYPGKIGVFAGSRYSTYLAENIYYNESIWAEAGAYTIMTGNFADFLATKVAYKFNLSGPAVTVQTACSTSLVAINVACQSLLTGESDMALAGGVSINFPHKTGYLYQEGSIASPDGHCRPFAAEAAGTLLGNGVGVVVLKPLEKALAEGDHIYAVVKGAAINNDGSDKIGFTAPSVTGQAGAIRQALEKAQVAPETVSYLEAHGTATALGDLIEFAALREAYDSQPNSAPCLIGAVKSNVGHLDNAAGVTGFIKTALALHNAEIPPTLHFKTPSPKIDFENSRFNVVNRLTRWERRNTPRRAGISSFGMGGTNAHVVLEEAPEVPQSQPAPANAWQLLPLSAHSAAALTAQQKRLAVFLRENPTANLSDVAYTLQLGRKAFKHRAFGLSQASNSAPLLQQLENAGLYQGVAAHNNPPVAFLFTGQGAQYPQMANSLYQTEAVFRQAFDECAAYLQKELNIDLASVIFSTSEDDKRLYQTEYTQPALFVVEYSLARLWQHYGLQPAAMLGHSLGEYVAAHLAGVFSLQDALRLVALRGQIMQKTEPGAMLAVQLAATELLPRLAGKLDLAAVNAPGQTVVSGTIAEIEALQTRLEAAGHLARRLHTSHAFHSHLLDGILEEFEAVVARLKLNPPQLPFVSNLTGDWITQAEATNPHYWSQHLRGTVRFGDGVAKLLERAPNSLLLEIGPGNTLVNFARAQGANVQQLFTSLPGAKESKENSGGQPFVATLGKLWLAGVNFDWSQLHSTRTPRRLALPTYPFEHKRFWVEPRKFAPTPVEQSLTKKSQPQDWFYTPGWKRAPLQAVGSQPAPSALANEVWLLLSDPTAVNLHNDLTALLGLHNVKTISVAPGKGFASLGENSYSINPRVASDYITLLQHLQETGLTPVKIVNLWAYGQPGATYDHLGYYSLLYTAQALYHARLKGAVEMTLVSDGLYEVTGHETVLYPGKAAAIGILRALPQEYPGLVCRQVDFADVPLSQTRQAAAQLYTELGSGASETTLAYRGNYRWVQHFEPLQLTAKSPNLRENGVYLITGGTGNIGLQLAAYLSTTCRARLALVSRQAFASLEQLSKHLTASSPELTPDLREKLQALQQLEAHRERVLFLQADSSNEAEMRQVIEQTEQTFGPLNGVIHSAGFIGEKAFLSSLELNKELTTEQFRSKVEGVEVLTRLLTGRVLDFCILQSSLAAFLGGYGMCAYAAANSYLDAVAQAQNQQQPDQNWLSVNWDGWNFNGELAQPTNTGNKASMGNFLLTPAEGTTAFSYLLNVRGLSQIAVSTGDLPQRVAYWLNSQTATPTPATATTTATQNSAEPEETLVSNRPALSSNYVEPQTLTERSLASIWEKVLGVQPVGTQDSFYELGGDSIMGLQIVTRAREANLIFAPQLLFMLETIAELAAALDEKAGKEKVPTSAPPKQPVAPAPSQPQPDFSLSGLDDDELAGLLAELEEETI